jgi:hypothetical protein
MSIIIPQLDGFSELFEYHVYDHYDIPIFFSAVNKLSHYYLFFNAESTDQWDRRFMIEISKERLVEVESWKVSILDVFTWCENQKFFEIITDYQNIISQSVNNISSIDLSALPPQDDFLSFQSEVEFTAIDLFSWSTQKNGIWISMRLKSPTIGQMTAPVEILTNLLSSFQWLFNNIAYALNTENYSQRWSIPRPISEQTQLQFAWTYSWSMGVKLLIPNRSLFESELASRALNKTMDLMSLRDIDQIKSVVQELKNRPITKFKELLKNIQSNQIDLELSQSSSTLQDVSQVRVININHDEVENIYTALSELLEDEVNVLEVKWTLVGIDIQTKNFHIETEEWSFKWKILENILNEDTIQTATINKRYIAQIEERKEIIEDANINIKYFLVAISYESSI